MLALVVHEWLLVDVVHKLLKPLVDIDAVAVRAGVCPLLAMVVRDDEAIVNGILVDPCENDLLKANKLCHDCV